MGDKLNLVCLSETDLLELCEKVVEALAQKHNVREKKWCTGQEAMEILGIKKSSLQALRDNGEIRYSQRYRRTIMYDIDSLEAYLEKHVKEKF